MRTVLDLHVAFILVANVSAFGIAAHRGFVGHRVCGDVWLVPEASWDYLASIAEEGERFTEDPEHARDDLEGFRRLFIALRPLRRGDRVEWIETTRFTAKEAAATGVLERTETVRGEIHDIQVKPWPPKAGQGRVEMRVMRDGEKKVRPVDVNLLRPIEGESQYERRERARLSGRTTE